MLSSSYFFSAVFSFVSVVLCLVTGAILLLFARGNASRRYLGFFYLALAYGFTTVALYYGGLTDKVPHLFRTGNFCWMICLPLSWMYVRTAITGKPLNAWDLLPLIAVLLYLVDFFPFFMLSGAHKAEEYRAEINNLPSMLRFPRGWLFPLHTTSSSITYIQTAVYWFLQLRLILSRQAAEIRKQKPFYSWLIIFTILETGLILPFLLLLLFGFRNNLWISAIPPTVGVVLSSLALLLNPAILYGQGKSTAPARTKPVLDTGTTRNITTRLKTLMEEGKPFLDANFTLSQLADALGVPPHKLSACINQATGSNFNEYLNQWRIQYCLELFRNGEIVQLNLHGIATMCGFNNRKTFSAAFKKITGESPSAVLHRSE